MLDIVKGWLDKHFSDPQAVMLATLILLGGVLVLMWGDILAPVLASVIIAYMLEGIVRKLRITGLPRIIAVFITFIGFITFVTLLLFGLVPLVSKQLSQLIRDFPEMLNRVQQLILTIPEKYPLFPQDQINEMVVGFNARLVNLGETLVEATLGSVVDVFTILVYMVVVPLLVFFLMKDKVAIIKWCQRFAPSDRGLSYKVWKDVDVKMGNYIRGKMLEILIVGVATFIPLKLLGLNYAATLSLFVGLSVIIPYVGAVAVTIPVALIAWFQWGPSSEFVYVLVAYLVVQGLDGNVLVPILFSEVVNMHPSAIIISVLFFGGLWGVWGVFFAIPLATLVQAVLNSWPSIQQDNRADA